MLITAFYHNPAETPQRPHFILSRAEQGWALQQPSEKSAEAIDHTPPRTPIPSPRIHSLILATTQSTANQLEQPSPIPETPVDHEQRITSRSSHRLYKELRSFISNTSSPSITHNPDISIAQKTPSVTDELKLDEALSFSNRKHSTMVSAISVPSYYGTNQSASHGGTLPPSPAILGPKAAEFSASVDDIGLESTRSKHRVKSSSISFNELLRQQSELDKSIAALRLYTAGDSSVRSTMLSDRDSSISRVPDKRIESETTGSYVGRKLDSLSNRSEFSLSVFPDPPGTESEGLPNSVKLERLVGRARTLRLEPIIPIKVGGSSLPVSPNQFEGTSRMESAGTQYDVTSFINGLTIPGRGSNITTASECRPISEVVATESNPNSMDQEDEKLHSPAPAMRPMILTTSTIVGASVDLSSNSNPTELPEEVTVPKRTPPPLRPLLLGTAAADVAVLGSSSKVPIGSRTRLRQISKPSIKDEGEQAPGAFERPRIPITATQDDIRQAYRKESLKTHPDRLPKATSEEKQRATESFQALADAYYVLSDPARRRDYDAIYTSKPSSDRTSDPNASPGLFSRFSSSFTGSSTEQTSQSNADYVFADVFEELLRPEVERHVPWWSYLGAICGGGLGFIVANVPGFMVGAYAGNRLGAVRDAKGKSVAAVFNELGGSQKAQTASKILRALALKVLGSAL
ncbi:hypothetical protein H0H92_001510 [Tricholoma furcatifolium]|nr:hypothetical protein H0H92_001510 [Tricholoma furcatifolium]